MNAAWQRLAHWLTAYGFRVKHGMTAIRHFFIDYNGVDLHPSRGGVPYNSYLE